SSRRRHTRFSRDWSSDVCSSDLGITVEAFIDLLKRHSTRTLPANVLDQVGTWERKVQSVTLRAKCDVIECRTAEQAQAFLQANRSEERRVGKEGKRRQSADDENT